MERFCHLVTPLHSPTSTHVPWVRSKRAFTDDCFTVVCMALNCLHLPSLGSYEPRVVGNKRMKLSHGGYHTSVMSPMRWTRRNVDEVSNQRSLGGIPLRISPSGVRCCEYSPFLLHHGGGVYRPLECFPQCCFPPLYIFPAQVCKYVFPGESDALDYYMLRVQRPHIAKLKNGRLQGEYARTSQDTTFWGLNLCFRYVELGTNSPPPPSGGPLWKLLSIYPL